jgi:hypothetical protein
MRKIVHVQVNKGTLYSYILSQKTKLEAMPEWKKHYFQHYLPAGRSRVVAPRSAHFLAAKERSGGGTSK